MWAQIHRPTMWQDFVGNTTAIQKCKQWLRDFEDEKAKVPRVLIISGPEGCGKSLAAELLLHKAGYKTYTFSVDEIKNHKENKHSLDNFCNLYLADLRKLGAAGSQHNAHGIIVEDFDSLSRSDLTFTGTITKMIKKHPSYVTPLIVTTDDSKHKISASLIRHGYHVPMVRILERDLVNIAMRVAVKENLYLNNDAALVFAQHAYGDARQLLGHMEMFYVDRLDNTKVSFEDVVNFIERNKSHNYQKQCKSFEGDLAFRQSSDERILGAAIGDRGDRRRENEKQAALHIACNNCVQFTPLFFQAYPKCIPNQASLNVMAEIGDYMSLADQVKEELWGCDAYYDIYSCFSIDAPIRLLRSCNNEATRNFTVSTRGYETYYGSDNTRKNQLKIIKSIRAECPATFGMELMELWHLKTMVAHLINHGSDEEIVDMLFSESELHRIHPNVLDTLNRLKGGTDFTLKRSRKKRLLKLYEKREDYVAPTIKFIESSTMKTPKKDLDPNDIFVLDW